MGPQVFDARPIPQSAQSFPVPSAPVFQTFAQVQAVPVDHSQINVSPGLIGNQGSNHIHHNSPLTQANAHEPIVQPNFSLLSSDAPISQGISSANQGHIGHIGHI